MRLPTRFRIRFLLWLLKRESPLARAAVEGTQVSLATDVDRWKLDSKWHRAAPAGVQPWRVSGMAVLRDANGLTGNGGDGATCAFAAAMGGAARGPAGRAVSG